MLSYFSQPYPLNTLLTRNWFLTSAGTGTFIAVFLILFQPFGSAGWHDPYKLSILAGYGGVTFVCLAGISLIIPRLFRDWTSESHWTIGREIVGILFILTVIAAGNLLYSQWMFNNTFSLSGFLLWLGITMSIGAIPTTVITLLNHSRLLRKYATESLMVKNENEVPEKTNVLGSTITLIAENEKDSLTVAVDELLFIESANNYSEVVFWQSQKHQKVLIRSSLSRLEEQISHGDVIRCHRSFIINLRQVNKISGNAQGYKLELHNWDSPLPVARRYTDLVANYFRK